MPIVDLQKRFRELGRIRIGQSVLGANGKRRPEKLDKFRLTSASKPLLEKVAGLYGGQVREWEPQGKGASAWEVLTESDRLPVLVPPQAVSQYYELWSGGGCQRRCDGVTELLSCQPCPCGPNPEEKTCKPTTRLNVILREVEGIGVWRLESHGWNSAVELPDVADFLARANGYVEAYLALEERVTVRDGQTNRFMVPTLEVGVTPAQLMAGADTAIEPAPAIEAVRIDVESVRAALLAVESLDDLRSMWPETKAAGLQGLANDIARKFQDHHEPEGGKDEKAADRLYARIMETVPEDTTTTQVEEAFKAVTGVEMETADADALQAYLDHLG